MGAVGGAPPNLASRRDQRLPVGGRGRVEWGRGSALAVMRVMEEPGIIVIAGRGEGPRARNPGTSAYRSGAGAGVHGFGACPRGVSRNDVLMAIGPERRQ